MSNGTTIYSGPSQINGADIKAIITGTKTKSVNVKTGDMAQMWMFSADVKPTEAAKTGADSAVCGECPHRPLLAKTNNVKPCYVKATYDAGVPTVKKPLRLGAYGEPTALPFELVQDAVNNSQGHTGYTHQWKEPEFQQFKTLLMASVDSIEEQIEAQGMGWRTFRVRKATDALMPGEIQCPASKWGGIKTNCAKCLLCSGTSLDAKNVSEVEH